MRVLHVVDTLDRHPGMFAVTLPGLCAALGKRGIRCDVVAGVAHDGWVRSAVPAENVTVVDEDDATGAMQEIAPLVKAADVVHVHAVGAEVSKCAAAASRACHVPLVVSTYGEMTRGLRERGKLATWSDNRRFHKKYKSAAVLHCFCEQEARLLRRRGIKAKTTVLPVGFDGDAGKAPGGQGSREPLKLPDDEDKRVLAYFGDIDGRYGLPQFLKACDELEDEMEQWRIVIAGRAIDNWLDMYQAGARRHGKEHLFAFIVYPDFSQQAAVLEAAEFVIVPSLSPVPPISAMWAMWFRRPVLVSREVDLPLVQERGAGVVVEHSRNDILRGFEKMVTAPPERLRQMGEAAAALVRESHSWAKLADDYVAMYRATA